MSALRSLTRSRIGDWEAIDHRQGCKGVLLTMVERKTLYTVIVRYGQKSRPAGGCSD